MSLYVPFILVFGGITLWIVLAKTNNKSGNKFDNIGVWISLYGAATLSSMIVLMLLGLHGEELLIASYVVALIIVVICAVKLKK